MPLRASLAPVVARVRALCGITEDAYAGLVSDDEIGVIADRTRIDVRQLLLHPLETIEAGTGRVLWREFIAPLEDFESTAYLQSGNGWALLTPSVTDLNSGRWTFADHQSAGVFLTGTSHDRYAVAVDVLELLAATQLTRFDFASGNGSFSRSQVLQQWRETAALYARRVRPTIGQLYRGDVLSG